MDKCFGRHLFIYLLIERNVDNLNLLEFGLPFVQDPNVASSFLNPENFIIQESHVATDGCDGNNNK